MSAIGTPDVAAYLAALERELADLAADERDDLLEEVEASLLEIDEDPVACLGPPARFAAELRSSAGLPPAPLPPAPPERRRSLRERLATSPTLAALRALARELAPIWWAIRAYIAVLVLAELFAAPLTMVVWIPRFGSAETGAAILGLAVVASVAIGIARRRDRLPLRAAWIALDLVLAVCALALVVNEFNNRVLAEPIPEQPVGVVNQGIAVNNIFVYDVNGKLLRDVRLYDSYGQPFNVRDGDPDSSRRVLKTRGGIPAFNTFPIRFFEPGTRRVKNADAAPPHLKPPLIRPRSSPSP
jgi:uncharacterized membrane protein